MGRVIIVCVVVGRVVVIRLVSVRRIMIHVVQVCVDAIRTIKLGKISTSLPPKQGLAAIRFVPPIPVVIVAESRILARSLIVVVRISLS